MPYLVIVLVLVVPASMQWKMVLSFFRPIPVLVSHAEETTNTAHSCPPSRMAGISLPLPLIGHRSKKTTRSLASSGQARLQVLRSSIVGSRSPRVHRSFIRQSFGRLGVHLVRDYHANVYVAGTGYCMFWTTQIQSLVSNSQGLTQLVRPRGGMIPEGQAETNQAQGEADQKVRP